MSKNADGVLTVAGMTVTEIADQVGTPAYVLDEADLRARARAFAEAFAGWDVYYAAKSFLCTAVARWVSEEGLGIDVCTGGELAVVAAGRGGPAPGRPARQQQEHRRAAPGADRRRGADHRRLVRRDRPAGRPGRRAGRTAAGDGAGHHRGRGAHPRVHRHRARGPEVRLLHRRRRRGRGAAGLPRAAGAGPGRDPLPYRVADLRRRGLRGGRPADAAPARRVRGADRHRAARARPRRRLRHRLHQRRLAVHAGAAGHRAARDHRARVRRARHRRAAPVDRAGTGDQRAEHLRPLPGGHGQAGASWTAGPAGCTSPSTGG